MRDVMRSTALPILLMLASSVFANIVEMSNVRMAPLILAKKQDFTYSSGSNEEDFSAIRFDLALMPFNTISQETYALMIITADQDTSNDLIGLLTNGTQSAAPTDTGVQAKAIEWVDDVEAIIAPMTSRFAVYDRTIFSGSPNTTTFYNQTFSIPYEGVFSTYFLFGKHKPISAEDKDFTDEFSDFIDEVFDDDEPGSHNRALVPSHEFDTKQTHLLIKGQISFVNSFGFLNADQYPLMQFYLIMFFVYVVAIFYWVRLMRVHHENRVSLHYYFIGLLLVTCVECAVTFLEYDIYNQSGRRNLSFIVFEVFLSAFRETLSRILCLLIALGYGIVMNVLNRYRTKIGLLSFLFFIANAINQASFYVNQHKPLSTSVKVMTYLPQLFLDVIFAIWIVNALVRTLSYLRVKRQEFKLGVMKQFAVILTVGMSISALVRITKIFFELFNQDADAWQNEHKFQIAWFLAFTATLMGEAWTFRPTEGSKMIAEVDELLDETLTEMGAIEGDNNRVDSIEYAATMEKRMKQRELELESSTNFQFQAVSNGQNDMFKHLDRVGEPDGHTGKQIEFAIEEEEKEEDDIEKDLDQA